MSLHCPNDGGFLSANGCSHRNHDHAKFVKRLLAAKPRLISPYEADLALQEGGFAVNSAYNTRIAFGDSLVTHLNHHKASDRRRRKIHLLYAVATVKSGKRGLNPKGGAGSYAYAKNFRDFGMLVLTDKQGNVENVFNIIPKTKRA